MDVLSLVVGGLAPSLSAVWPPLPEDVASGPWGQWNPLLRACVLTFWFCSVVSLSLSLPVRCSWDGGAGGLSLGGSHRNAVNGGILVPRTRPPRLMMFEKNPFLNVLLVSMFMFGGGNVLRYYKIVHIIINYYLFQATLVH